MLDRSQALSAFRHIAKLSQQVMHALLAFDGQALVRAGAAQLRMGGTVTSHARRPRRFLFSLAPKCRAHCPSRDIHGRQTRASVGGQQVPLRHELRLLWLVCDARATHVERCIQQHSFVPLTNAVTAVLQWPQAIWCIAFILPHTLCHPGRRRHCGSTTPLAALLPTPPPLRLLPHAGEPDGHLLRNCTTCLCALRGAG